MDITQGLEQGPTLGLEVIQAQGEVEQEAQVAKVVVELARR
jgi:hypothetical protein